MIKIMQSITDETTQQIITILLSAVGVLVSAVVSYLAARLGNWLKSKTKDEKLRSIIDSTIGMAEDIVITVNQTYVDDLVKSGNFDLNAQKQALDKAKAIAQELIPNEAKQLITKEYNDLDKWLEVVIEAKVKEVKQALEQKV